MVARRSGQSLTLLTVRRCSGCVAASFFWLKRRENAVELFSQAGKQKDKSWHGWQW
jgi:hypothetical protein